MMLVIATRGQVELSMVTPFIRVMGEHIDVAGSGQAPCLQPNGSQHVGKKDNEPWKRRLELCRIVGNSRYKQENRIKRLVRIQTSFVDASLRVVQNRIPVEYVICGASLDMF